MSGLTKTMYRKFRGKDGVGWRAEVCFKNGESIIKFQRWVKFEYVDFGYNYYLGCIMEVSCSDGGRFLFDAGQDVGVEVEQIGKTQEWVYKKLVGKMDLALALVDGEEWIRSWAKKKHLNQDKRQY